MEALQPAPVQNLALIKCFINNSIELFGTLGNLSKIRVSSPGLDREPDHPYQFKRVLYTAECPDLPV